MPKGSPGVKKTITHNQINSASQLLRNRFIEQHGVFPPIFDLCHCLEINCNEIVWGGKQYLHGHNQRHKYSWNKGLTKETDKRIKEISIRAKGHGMKYVRNGINKQEEKILQFLEQIDANWKYVGDGKFWVVRKNPDFINRKTNQIVEYFGDYWHYNKGHDERWQEEILRQAHFAKYGYRCIIVNSQIFKLNDPIDYLSEKLLKEQEQFCIEILEDLC